MYGILDTNPNPPYDWCMNRWLPYWSWITAGILLIAAGWITITAIFFPVQTQAAGPYPRIGFAAPDFELTTLDGESISLSDHRGKVVFVNFWASWCPPCKSEMPAIQSIAEDYPPDQVVILSINSIFQDDLTAVQDFVVTYGLTFPVLLDTNGDVSRLYQVQALPTSYFIDRQGVIQKVVYGGPLSEALLRTEIDRLLEGGR